MNSIILPYQGVGLVKYVAKNGKAQALVSAVQNPLGKLAAIPPTMSFRQPCKVPDRMNNPEIELSELSLIKFPVPTLFGPKGKPATACEWLIIHWLENSRGEKVGIWETFALFLGATEEVAESECQNKRAIWRQHGYFSLSEWQAEQDKRAQEAQTKKLIRGAQSPLKPAPKFLPIKSDESIYEEQINSALWEHLRPMMPKTIAAKLAGNDEQAIQCFMHESEMPHDPVDRIEEIILQELNAAQLAKKPAPTDQQLSAALEVAGFKVSPDNMKKKRQAMGIQMARGRRAQE